ncbi:unnamed protein product [Pedinophyceae sp. YPF-701]|nr:unnamed protein product [Pedinophyceae sp. YPF-701]
MLARRLLASSSAAAEGCGKRRRQAFAGRAPRPLGHPWAGRRCTTTAGASAEAQGVAEASVDDNKPKSDGKKKKQQQQKKQGGNKKGGGRETGSSLEELMQIRMDKADALREAGQNPYAYTFPRTHSCAELQGLYTDLEPGTEKAASEKAGGDICVAGRLMAKRVMGKLAFLRIQDPSGPVQLYVDKKALPEGGFAEMKAMVDVGDIVGARCPSVRRTDKGELSAVPAELSILTKSIRPLPDKWAGLTDVEQRYRQRYVDLIMSPESRNTLVARSRIVSGIRRLLDARDFLEVETPTLQQEAGGADARPFVTYHNALGQDFTLRIATELHLKRLVVGGIERVYELGRIFRNEGISTRHNPEFTSIEVYQAYADYNDMMDLTEDLIRDAAQSVCGGHKVTYDGVEIDLEGPFRRASMHDLVQEATGLDFMSDELRSDLEAARAAGAEALKKADSDGAMASLGAVSGAPSVGHVVNELFEALVEDSLVQPTFVTDHPVEVSPLAKPHRSKPGCVERFELFVTARELANAFSELTDPVEQRRRLEAQIESHRARAAATKDKEGNVDVEMDYEVKLDEDFLRALEHGMPPTAGLGIGVDRLVMLLTDSPSIRDVIAFPLLKS